jgi:hypothetical protein
VGLPEPDLLLSVTYGVSLAQHAEWLLGKPELTICVGSSDVIWARAMGWIAEQVRGDCPFSYGDILNVGDRVTEDSEMSASDHISQNAPQVPVRSTRICCSRTSVAPI